MKSQKYLLEHCWEKRRICKGKRLASQIVERWKRKTCNRKVKTSREDNRAEWGTKWPQVRLIFYKKTKRRHQKEQWRVILTNCF